MKPVSKTVFKVGDFVSWAQASQLDLRPNFQRRAVWKTGAKSYLLDTIIRGLPVPIVFLRDRLSLKTITTAREVVDGQQRLRTVLSYISPNLVPDYDVDHDFFKISKSHNEQFAGKAFVELPEDVKLAIVGYEIPVHVFSADTEDRDVLQIFARLNATGVKLNDQELRNAEFFGVFKTLAYAIAYENLNRWQDWGVFSLSEISRMAEVEEVSDLIVSMHDGVHAKKKATLDAIYKKFDTTYPAAIVVTRRFSGVMAAIDGALGTQLKALQFSRKSLFNDLFVATYELMYGLHSTLGLSPKPKKLPTDFSQRIQSLSSQIESGAVSEEIARGLRGATSDKDARLMRVKFILEAFDHEFAEG